MPVSWTQPSPIVVSCARGLTPYAAQEAARLGYAVGETSDTTLTVRGSLRDAMRLNLWLRSAHRVLWPLARAQARNLDDLYTAVHAIPWEEWIDPAGYFTVNSAVWNDTIRDTRMPALRTKDAIADRIREQCGRRPDAGSEFLGAAVFVYWNNQDARIYLDTSGEPLSKRGYRKRPGPAPMQETLAAACILATGWDGATPFVAPMCGSGTPAIEAALIARRRAPGLLRPRFTFMGIRGFDARNPDLAGTPRQAWMALRSEARADERADGMPPIVATDIDPDALACSKQNAADAGVAADIVFDACDFARTPVPPPPGVVFLNPEYGARMGNAAELESLYFRIGDFFKQRCQGYQGYVFTGNLELSRKIGLRSARRLIFFNGPIECRLVGFDLYSGTRRKDPAAETEDAGGS